MVSKTAQQYLSQLGIQLSFGKSRQKEGGFSNFDEERMLARFIAPYQVVTPLAGL